MKGKDKIALTVGITDTLWQLNKNKRAKEVEQLSGVKVPEDCMKLAEYFYRAGAVDMEKAVGKDWGKYR